MRGATCIRPKAVMNHHVSIHAPHAGRDVGKAQLGIQSGGFNPRAPCGARPLLFCIPYIASCVSIHAPHAGRDHSNRPYPAHLDCFNPRAPCGARLDGRYTGTVPLEFQSTRPMRGATPKRRLTCTMALFQSTRPMRGATYRQWKEQPPEGFQSTRPMRGATIRPVLLSARQAFQSTRTWRRLVRQACTQK